MGACSGSGVDTLLLCALRLHAPCLLFAMGRACRDVARCCVHGEAAACRWHAVARFASVHMFRFQLCPCTRPCRAQQT